MKKFETAILQSKREIAKFIDFMQEKKCQSYLEIGCKFGGSLWRVANGMPGGAKVVGVDLPQGDGSSKDTQPHLVECVETLKSMGYDAHLILGDSTAPETVERVYALGPFDCVFIDGNHFTEFVSKDFANYSPIASKMVALHDINHRRTDKMNIEKPMKGAFQVPPFWDKVKAGRKFTEIAYESQAMGIGILWMN